MRPCCFEEALQHREPDFGVVDLEDVLLDRQRQRQELGEAVADPRCVVERPLVGELVRTGARGQELQELRERFEPGGQGDAGLRGKRRYLADDEPILSQRVRAHFEARSAGGPDMQDSLLRHIPGFDARERSRRREFRRGGAFRQHLRAAEDQAHAERRVVAEARRSHLDVALLEDPERQAAARKEHRVQREQRKLRSEAIRRVRDPASDQPSSRCRIRTWLCGENVLASRSTRYTERCRPPVQPIATVR